MTHVIEPAASGRARCRGCSRTIARGELRFGERLPNPFADGDMTIWFHLLCAAYKRPESISEVIGNEENELPDLAHLQQVIERSQAHDRLPNINGVERAPSARARCRHCEAPIIKHDWRLPISIFEEGMFNNAGNIHVSCAVNYFETPDLIDALLHFTENLNPADVTEIKQLMETGSGTRPDQGSSD